MTYWGLLEIENRFKLVLVSVQKDLWAIFLLWRPLRPSRLKLYRLLIVTEFRCQDKGQNI